MPAFTQIILIVALISLLPGQAAAGLYKPSRNTSVGSTTVADAAQRDDNGSPLLPLEDEEDEEPDC